MPTVTSRIFEIFPSTAVALTITTKLIAMGAGGTPGAPHLLTHPSAGVPDFLYFFNPDRILNYDFEPQTQPLTSISRMLEGTAVTRFEETEDDVIVTELWTTDGGKFSMPAAQYRKLREMIINATAAGEYLTWEPRSRSTLVHQIEPLRLRVGDGDGLDINEWLEPGRINDPFNPGATMGALDSLDIAFQDSGLLDRPVAFTFKIVGEV